MKRLLFTLPKLAMKEVFERYSSKAPNPLNTQFADRVDKKTAVQKHKEKTQQKNTTSLFPSSMYYSSMYEVPA